METEEAKRDSTAENDRVSYEARALLAAIVDSTDDAIISKDLDGIIRSWNKSAERIFGYTADEIIGKSILVLLPEDRKSEEEMIFARIRKGEKVEHFETQRLAKDGHLINLAVTISPIRGAGGEIIGASKVGRDIEDRFQAEAGRARLAAIIESSDDAIVAKNLKGIIQSWNTGAERLFGYMAEEMVGQSITKLLPPDRLDEETRILERLRKGEMVDHFETVRKHRNGRLVDVSVTISPIRDLQGRIIGASKVARDISDRKILEATLARLREELEERVDERTLALEQAHKEMESFVYSVSHDLRGPLRAIASTSTMLQEDYSELLPIEGRDMLKRQIAASKRLSQLIEDLLKYSRLGRSAMSITELDLTQIANDVAADLSSYGPRCEFEIQEGLKAVGDRSLVRLLLQNLMDNACKFSPEGGLVEVGCQDTALYVRDHGTGLDMAYAEKIFLPFERLVSNEEVPGTGIGLANVKKIIDRHAGSIWVHSNPGQGTTFYFKLG